jgi:hypothetical protein
VNRSRRHLEIIVLLAMLARPFACFSAPAQSVTEDQIKAAYLFNFAKFIEWPNESFATPTSPIQFCTLGRSPVADELDASVRGKSIDGHTIEVKHLHSAEEIKDCHLVFLSASAGKQEHKLVQAAKGLPVLLVAEIAEFAREGGTINFVMEDGRLVFEVNISAAQNAHLKISSKLLALARIVPTGEGK